MAKQSEKASKTSRGRKNMQVKDLSKPAKKLSSKQMKKVKGGDTLTSQKKGYSVSG